MHMICYMSKYDGADNISAVLDDISKKSKVHNRADEISGVLFFHKGNFLQVIEGERPALDALMKKINDDERHTDIEVLVNTEVDKRGFSDWNMDNFVLGEGHEFEVDMMKKLSDSFKKNLLPRSDTLIYFYKTLLSQPTYKTKKMLSILL